MVTFIPVEEHRTERTCFTSEREFYDVERREAALVGRYKEHLKSEDHVVSRLRVVPAGESHPIYSDLWDETARELIEAKGSATRDQLRLAVGQLLDYGRFVDAASRAILVPHQPSPDLVAYLLAAQVDVIYPDGDYWVRKSPSGS